MAVNEEAQRSLAKGAKKESTKELLESDRVQSTQRMHEITSFYERIMNMVENGGKNDGFLGAVQLIVPETFTTAKFYPLKVSSEVREGNASLDRYLEALGRAEAGTFVANPQHGETAIHIVDGQARLVGLHSFEKAIMLQLDDVKRKILKKEKDYQSVDAEKAQRGKLEKLLVRIRRFLTDNQISFVLYVDHIEPDGRVIGLPVEAEKRAYIEGNAYNAQASKEEVIRFEAFSPVVLALQEIRVEPIESSLSWMSEDYIEEESKSVSKNSTKLFTLSALLQSFSRSALGKREAIKGVKPEMFDTVGKRREFVRDYWKRISHMFKPIWVVDGQTPGERLAYLQTKREEQNVAFQAIFLQALGKVGHRIGVASDWDLASPLLDTLDRLSPERVDYRAKNGSGVFGYDSTWTSAMMKAAETDPATGTVKRYVFNNVEDSITKTYQELCKNLGLAAELDEEAEEEAEAEAEEAAEIVTAA
jgi:hypothetical protein